MVIYMFNSLSYQIYFLLFRQTYMYVCQEI